MASCTFRVIRVTPALPCSQVPTIAHPYRKPAELAVARDCGLGEFVIKLYCPECAARHSVVEEPAQPVEEAA